MPTLRMAKKMKKVRPAASLRDLYSLPLARSLFSICLISSLLSSGSCEPSGGLDFRLAIGGKTVQGIKDCSKHGINIVAVQASQDDTETMIKLSCGAMGTATHRTAQDFDPGTWTLTVQARTSAGLPLGREIILQVLIVSGEHTAVELALPSPPECSDGVDNDRDGRIDAADLSCATDGIYNQNAQESP